MKPRPTKSFEVDGATDLHVHCGPEGIPRPFDALQLAEHVRAFGLQSLVLKSHFHSTASWAEMAYRATGVRLHGSVTLNNHVGGINPSAVRAALGPRDEEGAFLKVVWLPTIHARAHLECRRAEGADYDVPPEWAGGRVPEVAERIESISPISVLAPDVQGPFEQVLGLVREHRLVLATGHIGREEVFHVVGRAREAGVEKVVVTHAQYDPPSLSIPDMVELARQGAWIELSYVFIELGMVTPADTAAIVQAVGAEHLVLSTDLGQIGHPTPGEGLKGFAGLLLEQGVDESELTLAMKENPRKLVCS